MVLFIFFSPIAEPLIITRVCSCFAAQYPHYLAGGANPHDLQAAAAAAGAYGALHNNLPPAAALNSYPRPALVSGVETYDFVFYVPTISTC